ncbi:penicillin-binding protein 2 [Candidatus Kinetoplastibacterium oncopeltii TCC290E]|uniref:Peptidoglycan D,D-transpeptidase MrdA n=1 Tax=Candidatus Kinetoplastidibacterium stringomonadis TCC290E TaxID=1208920 RepID=M1M9K8_9PROT|nr:penicillin-binding protein 2 [Candidatus Kinetoplastibacterium oncopeltii]AGF48635.1 penicillin-binding protein 2 [Candidatus Kinetoplastibacterium oncopeltii TCC290E]
MIDVNNSNQQRNKFYTRVLIGYAFAIFCFFLLFCRLWVLQISRHDGLSKSADKNRIAIVPIPSKRGEIFDRNGEVLACNSYTYKIDIIPAIAGNLKDILEKLEPIMCFNQNDIRNLKKKISETNGYKPITICNKLDAYKASWFAAHYFNFPGLELKARLLREYPNKDLAAHVLGYVGKISDKELENLEKTGKIGNYRGSDLIGKKGIEKVYEEILHGRAGLDELEITVTGRPVRKIRSIDPIAGSDIFLSIDIKLQKIAEEVFGDRKGSLVAINPSNGEVLALVSKPSFNPNLFVDGIDPESWNYLNNSLDCPLINRALHGTYPIGSTYKPFIALAALELGKKKASDEIFDPGYFEFKGHRFRNPGSVAYGIVNMNKAIVVSSDTYFYSLGLDIDVDILHDFVKQFGFGQITGIDLDGEKRGILPSTDWKYNRYKDKKLQKWYTGDTISLMVGQGYNSFTILQLAQATATLANDGIYRKPHIAIKMRNCQDDFVKIAIDDSINIPLKRDNISFIKNAMIEVAHFGTAKKSFQSAPYLVAGKTGTAQVYSLKGGRYCTDNINENLRDHAMFIGFAPADNPKIAVSIIVENAGWGSKEAAPIARKIFDYWLLQQKYNDR